MRLLQFSQIFYYVDIILLIASTNYKKFLKSCNWAKEITSIVSVEIHKSSDSIMMGKFAELSINQAILCSVGVNSKNISFDWLQTCLLSVALCHLCTVTESQYYVITVIKKNCVRCMHWEYREGNPYVCLGWRGSLLHRASST